MFLKNLIISRDDQISVTATLQDAVDKMSQIPLHYIIIVKENKPLGIISQNDIVRLLNQNVNFSNMAIDYAVRNLLVLHNTRLAEHALSMMIDNNIKKIIVVNSSEEYQGCLEQEDLIHCYEKQFQSSNHHISHLLNTANEAIILDENTTIKETLKVMVQKNITSLLVAKDEKPVGIISESDIVDIAKEHINQELAIKEFMHAPIVSMDMDESLIDMIELMKTKHIRRMVTFDRSTNRYHILNSKDVISDIKGSYTNFLESKLFDLRHSFNAINEYVLEIIDLEDEQVIFWTNSITKKNFEVTIDDNITKVIPIELWEDILIRLKNDKVFFDTIQIDDCHYQMKAHYGTILKDNIIKIFLNDITQIVNMQKTLELQNQMQQQMLFSQAKMAQLGEMIANIAHQWKQPLSVIMSSASGIEVQKEFDTLTDKALMDNLKGVKDSARYLSDTIEVFRGFVKEKKEFKEVVLQDRINKSLQIVSTALKNNFIELKNLIDYNTPVKYTLVLGELSQVLINIFNNAKDALVEKKTENPWIELDLQKQNDHILITIEDNAGGIPEDIIDDIFTQYFTTKDDNGTGLGLYMSKKIITDSLNGEIYARNTKNGAKFFIQLPLKS